MANGTITVRTTKDGQPATAAVSLYLRSNSAKIATKNTFIAGTGEPAKATFDGLDFGVLYYALAVHPGATIPSVVADYLLARPGPTAATDPSFASVTMLVDSAGTEGGTDWYTAAGGKLVMTPPDAIPHATVRGSLSTPGGAPAAGGFYSPVMEFPPGNKTYFEVPGTVNWTPDITAEMWFKVRDNVADTAGSLFAMKDPGGGAAATLLSVSLLNLGDGLLTVTGSNGAGGQAGFVFGPALAAQQWHHIAVVQSAGTVTVYVNGVSAGTGVANTATARQAKAYIGGYPSLSSSDMLSGSSASGLTFIGAVRVTNAVRYTAAFTPPTNVFPNH